MAKSDTKGPGKEIERFIGKVVHSYVPLSPSSIIWYQPRGIDAVAGKVTAGLAENNGSQPTAGWMTYSQLRADCLYTGICSGPNAW